MTSLEIGFIRVAILVHHSAWALLAIVTVGVGAFALSTYVRNKSLREATNTLWIICAFAYMAFSATGLSVGAIDNWQHQHHSCLLEALEKMEKK